MKDEIYQVLKKVQNGEQSIGEAQAELLFIFSIMQRPQFDELLIVRLKELPYTKHLDDGQYNDGQMDGFEFGARWAYDTLSRGLTVGNSAAGKGVCDGTKHSPFSIKGEDEIVICADCGKPYRAQP